MLSFSAKVHSMLFVDLRPEEGYLVNELTEKFEKCDISRLIDYHIKYITPEDENLADMEESRIKDSLLLT